MIKNITYSVAFPTSGVSLEGTFSPQPGITAVVGPNGVGKTFTSIELTRYLLYGKAALRGSASDYKKLDATGEFTIRGADYTVQRSPKKEQVLDSAGTVLAVGADAVTKKMTELMGYGLAVFDVCNASVQKKSDIFGQMRPADRKRMIDEVVNVTITEKVEKMTRDEANGYKREAEALTRNLSAPTKPEKPAGYVSSEKLESEYNELLRKYNEAAAITATMRAEGQEPDKPLNPRPDDDAVAALRAADEEFQRVEYQRKRLSDRTVPETEAPYTEEQLDAAEQRLVLSDMLENEVECPKCGDKFVPGHGHVELPDGPTLLKGEIRNYRKMIGVIEDSNKAREELKNLPVVKDMREEIKAAQDLERQWENYDSQSYYVARQRSLNHDAMQKLKALGEVPTSEEVDYAREQLFDARYYERQIKDFEKQKEAFDIQSKEIVELGRLSAAFREGGEALADARATLKALLAPSLSRVASSLLSDMTNGKYSDVIVDEDMDISVNGQSLETLSGGNETVANIALRLALGQVLVSQTFPVFVGDEMDAFADSTRRGAVSESMRALIDKGHLKQMIMITHRSVDVADHVIDLGNTE